MSSEVRKKLEKAMTVETLINMLSMMDLNAKILFSYRHSSGDPDYMEPVFLISELIKLESYDLYGAPSNPSGMGIIKKNKKDRQSDKEEDSLAIVVMR